MARLRHELSQRPLVAEESTFYLPSAIGWVVDGSAVSSRTVEPAEIRDNENGEATKRRNGQLVKTGRQRSAASEQYWADRKGQSFLETFFYQLIAVRLDYFFSVLVLGFLSADCSKIISSQYFFKAFYQLIAVRLLHLSLVFRLRESIEKEEKANVVVFIDTLVYLCGLYRLLFYNFF